MKSIPARPLSIFIILLLAIVFPLKSSVLGQSRPQRPDSVKGTDKVNQRSKPKTEEELKLEAEQKKLEEMQRNAVVEDDIVDVRINIVNVDAVVYNKKTGQIVTGMKKENFTILENGVKQDITNFATPEAPITVTLVMEYSKWSEIFGYERGMGRDSGKLEVIRPVAYFLSQFIKPPDDFASVIAFDIRPTPITDFTNDPNRIKQTIDLLLRNSPAFRENNLFDALKFALVGGKGDSVVLENSEERYSQYGGMVDIKAKRRALILVASGIDTFSRINYGEIRSIIQEAGIPIYIISTGNLFYKKYEHLLGATDSLSGMPGRLTFLQATNAMNTFAKESGGKHYQMTFEGEIPDYLQSINALMRNQYSLAYPVNEENKPGKKNKIEVMVDVNGDGTYDNKQYEVQHRPYYITPKEEDKAKQ